MGYQRAQVPNTRPESAAVGGLPLWGVQHGKWDPRALLSVGARRSWEDSRRKCGGGRPDWDFEPGVHPAEPGYWRGEVRRCDPEGH
jgi:hypothetical protein